MYPYTARRRELWEDLTPDQKINRSADDLDANDVAHEHFADDIASIKKLLIGILLTTTSACILLAIQIGINHIT